MLSRSRKRTLEARIHTIIGVAIVAAMCLDAYWIVSLFATVGA